MLPGALRRVVQRRSSSDVLLRVGEWWLQRDDSTYVALIETGDFDITAVDDVVAARVVETLASLYGAVSGSLQLLLRVRRWTSEEPTAHSDANHIRARLTEASADHRQRHLAEYRPLRRRVFIAVAHGDLSVVARDRDLLVRRLVALGIGATALSGPQAAGLFADFEGAWHEAVDCVATADGARLHRATFLTRLSGAQIDAEWLMPLVHVPVEMDLGVHIRPVTTQDALRVLHRRLRNHTAEALAGADAGRGDDIATLVAIDGVHQLRQRLASQAHLPLEVAVVAVAHAANPATLETAAAHLSTAWGLMLSRSATAHFAHGDGLRSALPFVSNDVAPWKLADAHAVAHLVPWGSCEISDPDGYRIGYERRTHSPVSIDPFARNAVNANMAVIATSGHGKSFTLAALMMEALRVGRSVIVMDPEAEYRRLVERCGGTYLNLTPGSGSALNIFDTGLTAAETAASVAGLLELVAGGLDVEERDSVEARTVALLRQSAAVPTLRDLPITDGARHGVALRRLCSGPIGDLLARPTSAIDTATQIIGFGLRDLPSELLPAVTYVIAQWLWTHVRRRQRRCHIVVDEVGLMLEHPDLRRLLVQLARRCRKYDASLVVATQNAADLLAASDATVIATNAATILLGGQRQIDVERMGSAFGLTPRQTRFLAAAARGDFLLLSGQRRAEVRVEVPPAYVEIATGATSVFPREARSSPV